MIDEIEVFYGRHIADRSVASLTEDRDLVRGEVVDRLGFTWMAGPLDFKVWLGCYYVPRHPTLEMEWIAEAQMHKQDKREIIEVADLKASYFGALTLAMELLHQVDAPSDALTVAKHRIDRAALELEPHRSHSVSHAGVCDYICPCDFADTKVVADDGAPVPAPSRTIRQAWIPQGQKEVFVFCGGCGRLHRIDVD